MGSYSRGSIASPLVPVPPNIPSGELIPVTPTNGSTSVASANGWEYFVPVDFLQPTAINGIIVEIVTTAGSVGSLLRAGIYNDRGDLLRPGGLPTLDAGTISGEVLGLREWTVAYTFPYGRSWLSVTAQGAPVTEPIFRVALGCPRTISVPNTITNLVQSMVRRPGITGALPSATGAPFAGINFAHEIFLRKV